MNNRDRERVVLKAIMQAKDLWMIRALVLSKRLEAADLDASGVLECKDKKKLYDELSSEPDCALAISN